jgi:NADH-quinone oxidoreductase subunit J
VVVYAGAVMVLYVFVVAYVGSAHEPEFDPIPGQRLFTGLLAFFLFVEVSAAVLSSALKALESHGPSVGAGFGNPAAIGNLLLEKFLVPFEASSILLLIAAVGAIVLAARKQQNREPGGDRNSRQTGGGVTPSGHSAPKARPEGVAPVPVPPTPSAGAPR